jgi:hypothetical protein
MSSEDEGASFGFSPPGGPADQQATRPAPGGPDADKPATGDAAAPKNASQPFAYAVPGPSPKANWSWLCIGALLGAGGTLIGTSFWLQGSYDSPSMAMDAVQQEAGPGAEAAVSPERVVADAALPADVAADASIDAAAPFDLEKRPPAETAAPEATGQFVALSDGDAPAFSPENGTSKDEGDPAKAKASAQDQTASAPRRTNGVTEKAAALSPAEDVIVVAEKTSFDGETSAAEDASVSEPSPSAPADLLPAEAVVGAEAQGQEATQGRENTQQADAGQTADREQPPATARAVLRRPSKRIYRVQLAAVDTEEAAQSYWRETKTSLPDLFANVEPLFDRREIDERIFYRVWIGEFDRRAEADEYCGAIKDKGQDCFVTRG